MAALGVAPPNRPKFNTRTIRAVLRHGSMRGTHHVETGVDVRVDQVVGLDPSELGLPQNEIRPTDADRRPASLRNWALLLDVWVSLRRVGALAVPGERLRE